MRIYVVDVAEDEGARREFSGEEFGEKGGGRCEMRTRTWVPRCKCKGRGHRYRNYQCCRTAAAWMDQYHAWYSADRVPSDIVGSLDCIVWVRCGDRGNHGTRYTVEGERY